MKQIYYLIVCFTFFMCSNKVEKKVSISSNVFSECLTEETINKLDNGVLIFEKHLKEIYGSRAKSSLELYKFFLKDFSKMSLTKDFFKTKKANIFLVDFKKSESFKVLYKLYEESKYEGDLDVVITERKGEKSIKEEVPVFYVLNENGKFCSCLRRLIKNNDLKDYYEMTKLTNDISPTLKANAMLLMINNIGEDINSLKLSIVFDLYYGSFLMFN